MSLCDVGRWPTLMVTGEIGTDNIDSFDAAIADAALRYPRLIVDLRAAQVRHGAAIGVLYRHADSLAAVVVASGSTLGRALSLAAFITVEVDPVGAPAPNAPAVEAHR